MVLPRGRPPAALLLVTVVLALAACSSHSGFVVPEVEVGKPQFNRIVEGHTLSGLVGGNDVRLLLNGEQLFPAMLEAIRGARQTITFANYLYEKGAIAEEMYRGALLHAKTLTIDGKWSSIGSANLDRRSFALNHELNLTSDDPGLARQLERIFAEDLQYAHEVTLEEWRRRGIGRLFELFVLPLRNQL